MKKNNFEILVGFLVLFFSTSFLLFFLKISGGTKNVANTYEISAEFGNIEGINIGSEVKMSGIKIGIVDNLYINNDTYNSIVVMKLDKKLPIPIDSSFKISTSGLIGGKYIRVEIGSEEMYFENGDTAEFTQSTMDLEDLIGRFIFNNGDENGKK